MRNQTNLLSQSPVLSLLLGLANVVVMLSLKLVYRFLKRSSVLEVFFFPAPLDLPRATAESWDMLLLPVSSLHWPHPVVADEPTPQDLALGSLHLHFLQPSSDLGSVAAPLSGVQVGLLTNSDFLAATDFYIIGWDGTQSGCRRGWCMVGCGSHSKKKYKVLLFYFLLLSESRPGFG